MRRSTYPIVVTTLTVLSWLTPLARGQTPMGTAFTYQGQLKQSGSLASGSFNMDFKLWDSPTLSDLAHQVGPTLTFNGVADPNRPPVAVVGGLFTVHLDFGGAAYQGDQRWLEITVSGTLLLPRQELTPAPYALALPAMRVEQSAASPSLVGGHSANRVTTGVIGATIGGGGNSVDFNLITDDYGTVGGGMSNRAGDNAGSTSDHKWATIGGGLGNTASGILSTVGGGIGNIAAGESSTVAGGAGNEALGDYSVAGGRRAKANYAGTFVWGDSTPADFPSTAVDQFLIRANGGVGINTNSPNPANSLSVAGNADFSGNVGIGTTTPSAKLDVAGTAQMTGFTMHTGAAAGYVLTADPNGVGTWQAPAPPSAAWSLTGNAGTDPNHYFLGTTDFTALQLNHSLRIEPTGASPNIIGGNQFNLASDGVIGGTISGGGMVELGSFNVVTDNWCTIGGGARNTAGTDNSDVTDAHFATVGGGLENRAWGAGSTVSGGDSNGAYGSQATVPGGEDNTALGDYSFAAGRKASADNTGAFVWGDSTNAQVHSSADNQFTARCSGGVRFFTNGALTLGVKLGPGNTAWSSISDRNVKHNICAVDRREVVARLAAVPISTWTYIDDENAVPHMGPMAQDFKAAFGLGSDDKSISTLDADGVIFAAIQGINENVKDTNAQIVDLQARLERLEAIVNQHGK